MENNSGGDLSKVVHLVAQPGDIAEEILLEMQRILSGDGLSNHTVTAGDWFDCEFGKQVEGSIAGESGVEAPFTLVVGDSRHLNSETVFMISQGRCHRAMDVKFRSTVVKRNLSDSRIASLARQIFVSVLCKRSFGKPAQDPRPERPWRSDDPTRLRGCTF
ncbi:MAG: hypothetical protein ACI9VM_000459 [Candidatus Azotimanducaceae bacterium]|jgi:hypothetical protein